MTSFGAKKALPFLALVAVLAGCSGQTGTTGAVDNSSGTSTQAASTPAAEQARFDMHRRGGGQEFLLFTALRDQSLNLSDTQKSTIENAIKTSMPAPNAEQGKTHAAALAAQIRAGKVDVSTMGPSADEISARQTASANALDTLHSTLTADQRKALVADIESHFGSKDGNGKHQWKHENRADAPNSDQAQPEHVRGERGHGGPMHGLLADLNLTQAQQDQIKAKMEANKPSEADREAMKAKMQANRDAMKSRLESFATDNFDAKAFVAAAPDMKGRGNRMAEELSIVTSVLDQAQREKLAQKIEAGPQMHDRSQQQFQQKPGTKL